MPLLARTKFIDLAKGAKDAYEGKGRRRHKKRHSKRRHLRGGAIKDDESDYTDSDSYTNSYSDSQSGSETESSYSESEDEQPVQTKRNKKMKGGAIISKADLRRRL